MKLRIVLLAFCLLTVASSAHSQTVGANRNNIDWKVIKTSAANIIFAPEMEAKAHRVADIVNYMNENNSLSIGSKEHKIDILIRNETIVPNGYVALGPYRSEFFATPPDDFNRVGSADWMDHLAIHEFRHVMQTANEKVGLTKIAYYLTGQSGWNGLKFFSIPQWVSEGDAVTMETSLTKSGRGRTPYFTRGLRALALENKNYNYHKWRNGSYDELMPNQYPFGYMLLSHLRNNKGSEVSGKIIREGAAFNQIIYPYSLAMKSKTGWTTTTLYQDAWKHFGDQWREEVQLLSLTPTRKITKDPKVVTHYHFPQFVKGNQIISLKSSFNQTENLVMVDGLRDSTVTSIGFSYSDFFNHQAGKITWTEYRQSARRFNTQYSDIYVLDLATRKKKRLTNKGKYFSPSLSSDAQKIVAIEINTDLKNSLHILDAESGKIERVLSVIEGATLARSIFIDGDRSIAYLIKKDNYIWIESMNLKTRKVRQLTPKSGHVIDAISAHGDYIYCSASFTGIDNIFKIPIDGSKRIEQITSVPVGAYEPSVSENGNTLIFTEYTTKGQMISTMDLSSQRRESNYIQLQEPVDMEWMDKVSARDEGGEILTNLPTHSYEKEDYRGLFKGLQLHSWAFSPYSSELVGGLQFNNILDDFSIFAGGGYNQNENRGFYLFNTKISKYYPVFEFQAETRARRSVNFLPSDTAFAVLDYDEFNLSGDVSLPFSWVSGNFFKRLEFGGGLVRRNLYNTKNEEVELDNSTVNTTHFFLQFSNLKRRAYQNVRSRLGYSFDGRYTRNLTDGGESKIIGTARLYLPGIDYNHSFRLTLAYQKEMSTNQYQLPDYFGYPRGYYAPTNDEVYKFGMDYMFPLGYPDIGYFGMIYLKRLKMNVFYDIGAFQFLNLDLPNNFQSVGSDLYFDIQAFNLIPMSLVLRYSYRLTTNAINTTTGGELEFFSFITF